MLTVIQTLPALDTGGVERGTLEVAEELCRRGHRSIVVSEGGRLLDELLETGSEHHRLPLGKKSPAVILQVSRLRELLEQTGADIVHARSRLPAWVAWFAIRGMPRATRPRFVTTVHGLYRVNAYSRIMVRGERVIAISNFIRNYIERSYPGIPPGKIKVIPRGVSDKMYHPDHRPAESWLREWHRQFPYLQGKTLITLPGRITRRKGLDDFLEIMARLAGRDDIHGLVVGAPSPGKQRYFRKLQSRARETGLSETVTFTGYRNDLRDIMSISAIVMSLSAEPEAFGRTALEALSLGIPVIAYDHGGTSEILNALCPDGLIPRYDISRAKETILRVLEKPPAIRTNNPYTLQRMLNSTMELYRCLADSPAV